MSTKDRMRSNGNAGEKNAAAAAAGTRLDPWYNTYADRALGMKQSEVRSLFAVANRPEVVSLAGGMPNIAGLPLDFLADMTARLIRDRGTKILNYLADVTVNQPHGPRPSTVYAQDKLPQLDLNTMPPGRGRVA